MQLALAKSKERKKTIIASAYFSPTVLDFFFDLEVWKQFDYRQPPTNSKIFIRNTIGVTICFGNVW